MTRPVKDNWSLTPEDGQKEVATFDSTAEMLESDTALHGRQAVYDFMAKPAEDWTQKEKNELTLSVAAMAGTVGVGAGLVGAMVSDFGNSFIPGTFLKSSLLAPVAMGLGMAAIFGIAAAAVGPEPEWQGVQGVLQQDPQSKEVNFHPGGSVENKVNLNDYKNAPIPELGQDGRNYGEQWWS